VQIKDVFSHWEGIRSGLIATLDKFEGDDLSFKPLEEGWSVGEISLHIANAEEGWFRYAVKKEFSEWPPTYTLEDYPTLDSIKTLLAEVHNRTRAYLVSLQWEDFGRTFQAPWGEQFSIGWVIWHVIEHEIHHRGELSLILGLLGREGLDV
jgi:uncharacterized damage-inducible protein DinB